MNSLTFQQIKLEEMYVIDLIQKSSGYRCVEIRKSHDHPYPNAV
ncbi:MAG: hypothetical protein R3C11_22440 [Planctomycetaceae bacterium]